MKSAKAVWNGEVVAESNHCIVVEGNFYFPPESVHMKYLVKSELSTHCPWKGDAVYYSLKVGGKTNKDCVWAYEDCSEQANRIKNYFAFWNGVDIVTQTDEEREAELAAKILSLQKHTQEAAPEQLIETFKKSLAAFGEEYLTLTLPTQFVHDMSFFNFSNSNDACFRMDHEWKIVQTNPTFSWTFSHWSDCIGLSLEEFLLKVDIIDGPDIENFLKKLKSHGWANIPIIKVQKETESIYFSFAIAITKHGELEELSGLQCQLTNITKEVELSKDLSSSQTHMRRLLDGLNEGLFYFDDTGSISNERSKMLSAILPESDSICEVGQLFEKFSQTDQGSIKACIDLLWPKEEDDSFFSDFESTISMLPKKTIVNNGENIRNIRFEYKPLYCEKGLKLERILVMTIDETEALKDHQQAIFQAERVKKVTKAAINFEAYQDFTDESDTIFSRVDETFNQKKTEDLTQLKRDLHTLKGSIGIYSFAIIASKIHSLEEDILEGKLSLDFQGVKENWKQIRADWKNQTDDIAKVLGKESDEQIIEIEKQKLNQLSDYLTNKNDFRALEIISSFDKAPLSKIMKKYESYLQTLSKKIEDKQVHFAFTEGSEDVTYKEIQQIDGALVHIFRNCLDHGIEENYIRAGEGKSEYGTLTLSLKRTAAQLLELQISDDGRGIDGEKLALKALESGVWDQKTFDSANAQDRIELIFAPSLSSKDEASEISGRGVGMDAVKKILEDLGGGIRISSTKGKGTTFLIIFPALKTPAMKAA